MNSILHTHGPRLERASGKPQRTRRRRLRLLKWFLGGLSLSTATVVGISAIAWRCSQARYDAAPAMRVPLAASAQDDRYDDRRLLLIQRDATHYDFVLEPTSARVARVVLSNIDISSLAPQVNATGYGAGESQQLAIDARDGAVDIRGGDGFEAQHLSQIIIASNHGHARGWHVLLTANSAGASQTYYRGEFQFPLGHYRELFEQVTGLDYADYRRELEEEAPLIASDMRGSVLR
jgi:hypothetical protein